MDGVPRQVNRHGTNPSGAIDVLFEDNHLLVVNKPAGLATMGITDAVSLHGIASEYLRHKYGKPGNVFVGIVSRLDTVTSGVIVMARTSKAASRLTPQFADHSGKQAAKVYLAILDGQLDSDDGELRHYVYKDDDAHRMRAILGTDAPSRRDDAKQATLRYAVTHRGQSQTTVAVRLFSGRKHQIRVQFAAIGHPLAGDRKYGATSKFGPDAGGVPGVALHSWRLQIVHPTLRHRISFGAQPPQAWLHAAAGRFPAELGTELVSRLQLPAFVSLFDGADLE